MESKSNNDKLVKKQHKFCKCWSHKKITCEVKGKQTQLVIEDKEISNSRNYEVQKKWSVLLGGSRGLITVPVVDSNSELSWTTLQRMIKINLEDYFTFVAL